MSEEPATNDSDSPAFVHLNVHSEYSLIDSIVRVKTLIAKVRDLNMPAVAITDVSNIYGLIKFYKACVGAGIKPVIGVDAWIANDEQPQSPYRLMLFAQDNEGYVRLCELLSRAWIEGHNGTRACISKQWLFDKPDGLLALSGGINGDIGAALIGDHADHAQALLDEYKAAFGDRFYLEISRTGRKDEEICVQGSLDLAAQSNTPVVATNPICFITPADFDAHEARVCIHEGRALNDRRRKRRHTEEQYLKSPAQMAELFSDVPEALANTVEIAKRCNVRVELGVTHLPNFPLEAGRTAEEELVHQSEEGLKARLAVPTAKPRLCEPEAYDKRLAFELDVINNMGFAGYFLIVADFIRWSKEHDIPVGPGRGSGAGSLVAYVVGITDLDPLEHELLFERFLNPERVSMPDFDIDFCMNGRDRVIEYVAERYGRDKVAQIITHGTMASRAVVRDVGRVMSLPFGFVDQLAKMIPFEVGMTLTQAQKDEPELVTRRNNEDDVGELFDTAEVLEGITRNVGKHAGGVVIAPSTLTQFTALYAEPGSKQAVTQLDMKDLESVGLVKFDFLGLRTLTIIDQALKTVNRQGADTDDAPVTVEDLPLDDEPTFELIRACRTTALFQLESRGMTDLVNRLQPDCFDDLVALVALYRPGPLGSGMVDDFVNCKHGRQQVVYPHPSLEDLLKPTHGVILYQEQVMKIAQVLSGYSLGSADLLRRAMGKKIPEEMAQQRAGFVDGASDNEVDKETSGYIFDLVEKFAGYGFNKSHSAAYALITYQTAWLKCHHTAAFMAASLSSDMENTDRVVTLMNECREIELEVLPPNVNASGHEFVPANKKTILFGLGAVKGVGSAAIEAIEGAREADGPFINLFDFCRRVDGRKVNRKVIESLIRCGAMDAFGDHRSALMASVTLAMNTADQQANAETAGQNDLFGLEEGPPAQIDMPDATPWDDGTLLQNEKDTLGLYLSGHPMDENRDEILQLTGCTLAELNPQAQRNRVVVAGFVSAIRTRNTNGGKGRMAFLTLDDGTARLEVTVFTKVYGEYFERIKSDTLVIIEGQLGIDERTGGSSMRAEIVHDLASAEGKWLRAVGVELVAQKVNNKTIDSLEQVLGQYRGGKCVVVVSYIGLDGVRVRLRLGEDWHVDASSGLVSQLKELAGREHVRVRYGSPDGEKAHSDEWRAGRNGDTRKGNQNETFADADMPDYSDSYHDQYGSAVHQQYEDYVGDADASGDGMRADSSSGGSGTLGAGIKA